MEVRYALFDLGNVVMEIDFRRIFAAWAEMSGVPAAEIARRYSFDAPYARFERGEIEAKEYFHHVRGMLGVDVADEDLERGWNALYMDPVPHVQEAIAQLGEVMPVYALTNTNASHQAHWSELFAPYLGGFEHIFVSNEIGVRKPESRCFEHCAAAMSAPLDSIVFFDDSFSNVAAARQLGVRAVRVGSGTDVRDATAAILAGEAP